MIGLAARLASLWRVLRRALNRSAWVVRLLGLPRSTGTDTQPGLVIVQIDGLSRRQLERAIERRRMPFVKKLIRDQEHHLHTLHSGVPSTTAAFQGELFYGVRCAVPAYSYFHKRLSQRVHMVDAPAASAVQEDLEKQGTGLLEGGSSYCAFFEGGTKDQHFCPKSLGLGSIVREMPLAVLGLIFLHGFALLRVAALLVVEFFLSVFDAVRGVLSGHGLSSEFSFIVHRVALCVLLRELCVMRVKADVERGVPIVYVDFIGYDEQSHMRGPDSRFAHWTLKGIDDSIKRIWKAARGSSARDYEVWIVSDHGQERTRPYREVHGKWIEEALAGVVAELGDTVRPETTHRGDDTERSESIGDAITKLITRRPEDLPVGANATWTVIANGPVGHCYAPGELPRSGLEAVARALVERERVPAAMLRDGPDAVRVITRRGTFRLPEEAAEIVDDPEMAQVVADDLVCLTQQPNSGEIVILGHVKGEPLISFALEHGGHGGIGPDEIRAFAILPPDAPVHSSGSVLRARDLRRGAMRFLGRLRDEPAPRSRVRAGGLLRVMTYNVHSCVGTDAKISPARIARVIARHDPDVVALQEVDVGRARTGGVDQAREIARALEMDFHFHPSLELAEERYGNAILSRLPMRLVKAARLPGPDTVEPRGVLWVEVDADGTLVQVISTHLGLSAGERADQVQELLSDRFLASPRCAGPVVVCGDFNLLPWSRTYRNLRRRLTDAQVGLRSHRPKRTWSSAIPLARLDHVFLGGELAVEDVEVPRTQLVRCSSDHLPVIVTVRVRTAA